MLIKILTSIIICLPYYLILLGIMYIINKNHSIDLSDKLLHLLNKSEKCFNIVSYYFMPLYLIITFALLVSILLRNSTIPLVKYLISDDALRLLKYLFETMLTLTLAVIGSIALFTSTKKNFFGRFSNKDVIKYYKIPNKVRKIILYLITTVICDSAFYFCRYILKTYDTKTFKMFFFILSTTLSIIALFYILNIFISILTFILTENTQENLISQLHKNIYQNKSFKFQTKEKYILMGLNELIELCKEQNSIDLQKDNIEFRNSIEKNKNNLFIKILVKSLAISCVFSWVTAFFFISAIETFPALFQYYVIMLLINLFLHILLITLPFKSSEYFIKSIQLLFLGNTFFIIKGKHIISFQGDIFARRKFKKYFAPFYNLISFFIDILETNQKYALKALKILSKIEDSNNIQTIYFICLALYLKKHKTLKDVDSLPKLKNFSNPFKTNITNLLKDINYNNFSNNDIKKLFKTLK